MSRLLVCWPLPHFFVQALHLDQLCHLQSILGQPGTSLHCRVCFNSPVKPTPKVPLSPDSLRWRVCCPGPHEAVHGDQDTHSPVLASSFAVLSHFPLPMQPCTSSKCKGLVQALPPKRGWALTCLLRCCWPPAPSQSRSQASQLPQAERSQSMGSIGPTSCKDPLQAAPSREGCVATLLSRCF